MGKLSVTFRVIVALTALAPGSRAATEGTLGSTSTCTLNFSVTMPARADITNLTDLSLSGWVAGDGAVTLSEDVCVYSTRPSGGYTVLANGSGTGGAFTLNNGSSNMAYTTTWNSGGVNNLTDTGISLTANTVSGALTGAATDSSSCNGSHPGPTARLIIGVSESAISSAPSGAYTGTLTLTITPN